MKIHKTERISEKEVMISGCNTYLFGLIKRPFTYVLNIDKQVNNKNAARVNSAFYSASRRCAFVLREENPKLLLEERAAILCSQERISKHDVLSNLTTLNDEIELVVIRVLLRFNEQNGVFPKHTQFCNRNFDELYKEGVKSLGFFKKNVLDKL